MTAAAAIAPEPGSALGERLADWAGPLVVKEVRADLRSRSFGVAFGLMLLLGFVVVMVCAGLTSRKQTGQGASAFMGTTVAFAVYGQLLLPFIAYRAMVKEREDETWVLLVLTGLGTDGIVRGKFLSAMAQLGLGAAATMPFMLLSYLLSGIGLLNVVLGVWWNLGLSVLLTSAAVGFAAQSESRLERALGHFVVLVVCCVLAAPSLAVTGALAFNGERVVREGDLLGMLIGLPVAMLVLAWCMIPAASAALALDSESRTHPARARVFGSFLVGTLATAGLVGFFAAHVEVILAASVIVSLLLLIVGFFSFSEVPGFPKATAADGYRRPGAFRSALMTVVLLAVSGAVCFAVAYGDRHRATGLTIAAPSFVALYLSLGLMLARLTPLKRLGARQATRIGFLAATALGIAVPTILSLLTDHRPDRGPAWVVNPLFGMVRFLDRSHLEGEAVLLGALALLMTFIALMLLHGEDGVRTNAH
jgi:hypothetical protein